MIHGQVIVCSLVVMGSHAGWFTAVSLQEDLSETLYLKSRCINAIRNIYQKDVIKSPRCISMEAVNSFTLEC